MSRITVIALVAVVALALIALLTMAAMVYFASTGQMVPSAMAAIATLAVQQLVSVVNAYIRSEGGTTDGNTSNLGQ